MGESKGQPEAVTAMSVSHASREADDEGRQ